MIKSPPNQPKQKPITPTVWQWGPWSIFTWSAFFYIAIMMVQTLFGVVRSNVWPLWAHDYTIGAYPCFWLVYVCLPLGIRDGWVRFKQQKRLDAQTIGSSILLLASSLVAFHWVYGWY